MKTGTLHFTSFLTDLIFASQNAPRYFALTSVPTAKYGGSSTACNVKLSQYDESTSNRQGLNINKGLAVNRYNAGIFYTAQGDFTAYFEVAITFNL